VSFAIKTEAKLEANVLAMVKARQMLRPMITFL